MAHGQRADVRTVSCAAVGSIQFSLRIASHLISYLSFFFSSLPSLKPVHGVVLRPTIFPSSLFPSSTHRILQSFAGKIVSELVGPSSYFLNEGLFFVSFPFSFFRPYHSDSDSSVFGISRWTSTSFVNFVVVAPIEFSQFVFREDFVLRRFLLAIASLSAETMANSDRTHAPKTLFKFCEARTAHTDNRRSRRNRKVYHAPHTMAAYLL